jgi:cold shock CspA family protein
VFNPTKGYRFIKPNDNGTDVFVHISAVEKAGHAALLKANDNFARSIEFFSGFRGV